LHHLKAFLTLWKLLGEALDKLRQHRQLYHRRSATALR
jgi:hypothetical protein